jgi:hypothetical protein
MVAGTQGCACESAKRKGVWTPLSRRVRRRRRLQGHRVRGGLCMRYGLAAASMTTRSRRHSCRVPIQPFGVYGSAQSRPPRCVKRGAPTDVGVPLVLRNEPNVTKPQTFGDRRRQVHRRKTGVALVSGCESRGKILWPERVLRAGVHQWRPVRLRGVQLAAKNFSWDGGPEVQFGRHDNAIDKGIVEEFTRYVPLIR